MAVADNPHAIVVPYPFFGHITPSLVLSLHLASRPAFSVTYLLPEILLHGEDLFAQARESGLDVKCAAVSCGVPADMDAGEAWMEKFPGSVDEVIGSMRRTAAVAASATPWILVTDSLHTCMADIAKKHGMIHVSLWISSATAFSLNYHLDLLVENGNLPFTEKADPIDFIPGIQSIARKDLPSYIRDPNVIPLLINVAFKAFEQVKKADIILCDTVEELEPQTLEALNQKQPIYAIGPLTSFDDISKKIIQKLSMRSRSDCTKWLDSKSPGSVLYIAFGSLVQLSKHEIREIAHGLLLSRVNFLWVLKVDGDDIFPVGFEEDVKDRGVVIPWCDQSEVLSNPSVGGFLTHCGWNSVLESAWSGVPMICYPSICDQHLNRKLVVNDWKFGIELYVLTREEIVGKIDLLMQETSMRNELKEEAKKVQKIVRHSLEKEGSSYNNFDRFLEHLKIELGATRSKN